MQGPSRVLVWAQLAHGWGLGCESCHLQPGPPELLAHQGPPQMLLLAVLVGALTKLQLMAAALPLLRLPCVAALPQPLLRALLAAPVLVLVKVLPAAALQLRRLRMASGT